MAKFSKMSSKALRELVLAYEASMDADCISVSDIVNGVGAAEELANRTARRTRRAHRIGTRLVGRRGRDRQDVLR